jgi:hypothetical protein
MASGVHCTANDADGVNELNVSLYHCTGTCLTLGVA